MPRVCGRRARSRVSTVSPRFSMFRSGADTCCADSAAMAAPMKDRTIVSRRIRRAVYASAAPAGSHLEADGVQVLRREQPGGDGEQLPIFNPDVLAVDSAQVGQTIAQLERLFGREPVVIEPAA